jgi:hypothetical protein
MLLVQVMIFLLLNTGDAINFCKFGMITIIVNGMQTSVMDILVQQLYLLQVQMVMDLYLNMMYHQDITH